MKKAFAVAAAVLLFVTGAKGAAIAVQADDTNGFSSSSGAELGINNLVRVGWFNLSDEQISASSDISNPVARDFLNANFIEFGATRIGAGYNIPGHFETNIDRGPTSDSLGIVNTQVYLWVFASTVISAGTDPASVAASVNSAFEHGIFYFDKAIKDAWRFRAQGEIPNNSTVDIADLTDPLGNLLLPGAHVVVGAFPRGTSARTNAPNFGLAIPEPSSAGFLALGAASLLTRRRKTK